MSLLTSFFNVILYQPLFNALVLLYDFLPGNNFGLAIIILTVLIRLILYPSFLQSIRSQKAMNDIQPKIQEIQREYKNDQAKQAQLTMELYKKEKISQKAYDYGRLMTWPNIGLRYLDLFKTITFSKK